MQPQVNPSPSLPKFGVKAAVVLLLIGIGLLLASNYFGSRGEDYRPGSAPECGGKVMSPRDVCIGSGGGDYEEMQDQEANSAEIDKRIGVIGRYAGLAFLLLALLQFVRAAVRIRQWSRSRGQPAP
jgi:hypothetical protein